MQAMLFAGVFDVDRIDAARRVKGRMEKWSQEQWARLDRDRDGVLTVDEYMHAAGFGEMWEQSSIVHVGVDEVSALFSPNTYIYTF